MEQLIKHLWRENREQIVARSLLHCHTFNLHSVMLLESPGKTIRLYVAEPGNLLFMNHPYYYASGMSLGFHPHHCNLTLQCVKGRFMNWTAVKPSMKDQIGKPNNLNLRAYRYQSQISEGEQGFKLVNDKAILISGMLDWIEEGKGTTMLARTLHTVATDPFQTAAWLVFEGREDPDYNNLCYSTRELDTLPKPEGFYQPTTEADVLRLLQVAGFNVA